MYNPEKEKTPEQIRETAYKSVIRKIIKYAKDNGLKSVIHQKEFLEQNISISNQHKELPNEELLKAYNSAIETIIYNSKNNKK